MRSSKLGVESRNGIVSYTGIRQIDGLVVREDLEKLKNKIII